MARPRFRPSAVAVGVLAAALAVAAVALGIRHLMAKHSQAGTHPELIAIEYRSPIADLRARLVVGDHRFLALHGVGYVIPGVPEEEEDLQARHRLRFVQGTSDAIVSDEHLRLQAVAYEYAKKYNAELLRQIRDKGLQPNRDFLGRP